MDADLPEKELEAEFLTFLVNVVASKPRIYAWMLWLPGSQFLNSINTTHWGLKVGESYHDLKMRGLYRTKPEVDFAATLAARDERAVCKFILVGMTHFTNEEIKAFGKSQAIKYQADRGTYTRTARHRLRHTSWYHFWFDNCQHFATDQLAQNLLCARCGNFDPVGWNSSDYLTLNRTDLTNANLRALSALSHMRRSEAVGIADIFVHQLIDWSFGLSLTAKDVLQSEKGYYYLILRATSYLIGALVFTYYADQRKKEVDDDRKIFSSGYCCPALREIESKIIETNPTPEEIARLRSWVLRRVKLIQSVYSKAIDDEQAPMTNIDQDEKDEGHTWLRTSIFMNELLIVILTGLTIIKIFEICGFNPNKIAVLVTPMGIPLMRYKDNKYQFPLFQPTRKGRLAVNGSCEICFIFSRLRFWRTVSCSLEQHGRQPVNPPAQTIEKLRWFAENGSYLCLRVIVGWALLQFMDSDVSVVRHCKVQVSVQCLLNPFSPVTPVGTLIRRVVFFFHTIFFFLEPVIWLWDSP